MTFPGLSNLKLCGRVNQNANFPSSSLHFIYQGYCVGLHAPVLLMLDKATRILSGNGFQGGPTPLLLQVGQKDHQRRKVTAHGAGPAIAPLMVLQIVLDIRTPRQFLFGQLLEVLVNQV
jgi:hypothetical protein